MARKVQSSRLSKGEGNLSIEQVVASDDSLIPSADELGQYQAIDPNIIPWLLEQTKREQEHRHVLDNRKVELLNKSITNDRLLVSMFFIFVMAFVAASVFLIWNDKDISGSIFGLCGIVGSYFLYQRFFANRK